MTLTSRWPVTAPGVAQQLQQLLRIHRLARDAQVAVRRQLLDDRGRVAGNEHRLELGASLRAQCRDYLRTQLALSEVVIGDQQLRHALLPDTVQGLGQTR